MAVTSALPRTLDALTSATLKHVRDEWWDDAFTDFLVERLRPRAGNRILDVGCGTGKAELWLSRLRLSQVALVGLDRIPERTATAARLAREHNMPASFAAADASQIPFADASFDSTFCVAVLQHIADPREALREFARVTRPNGRILAVEPDNAARYWYSSSPEGMAAFAAAQRFFDALVRARGEASEPRVGPHLPTWFEEAGIEPIEVQLFPVSLSNLGPPERAVWDARRKTVARELEAVTDKDVRSAGDELLRTMEQYEKSAASAGAGFVEIQSTLLFAVVGQRQG